MEEVQLIYVAKNNKEIDQGSIYVFSFFIINKIKLFWSIVEWYLRVNSV